MASSSPSPSTPPAAGGGAAHGQQPVSPADLVCCARLGRGGFGCVQLARHRTNPEQYYAVKRVWPQCEWDVHQAVKEYEHLRLSLHPNLVQVHNFNVMPDGEILIVMELCRGGDLSRQIAERVKTRNFLARVLEKDYFPEEQVLNWLAQLACGLKHLHDRKILHRDIKPQNVFFKEEGLRTVKLGDLGCSTSLASTNARAQTCVGTAGYFAPEMLHGAPYDAKCDVWALGVVVYELCRLKLPYRAPDVKRTDDDDERLDKWRAYRDKIVAGKHKPIPGCYSSALRQLVDSMLSLSPASRPSVNQLLAHRLLAPVVAALYSRELVAAEFSHTVLHADGRRNGVAPVLHLAGVKSPPRPAPPPAPPAPAVQAAAAGGGGPKVPRDQPAAAAAAGGSDGRWAVPRRPPAVAV